jgi:hypothetical protein
VKKGLKRTTIRLESSIPVWEDRQAGDTSIDDSENQGTRPVAETGAGFHQRHVSLLVLHPWNVVRGHDLSEKVQSEERDLDLSQKKDRTAIVRKVGTVYAEDRGEIPQHDHGVYASGDSQFH